MGSDSDRRGTYAAYATLTVEMQTYKTCTNFNINILKVGSFFPSFARFPGPSMVCTENEQAKTKIMNTHRLLIQCYY